MCFESPSRPWGLELAFVSVTVRARNNRKCKDRTLDEGCLRFDTVRDRSKQETQRETCDTAREPKATQVHESRSFCAQGLPHGSARLGYFGYIVVVFRGHGFHALRLLFSSLLLIYNIY